MYISFYTIHNLPVQFLYVVMGLTEIYIICFPLNCKILNALKVILDFCMFKCCLIKICPNGPFQLLLIIKIRNLQSTD